MSNLQSYYHSKLVLQEVDQLQYIPRNMHTVFALLCFVVVILDWFYHIHQAYFTGTVAI